MITNIHRAKAAGDIQRYVRYTLAPKEETTSRHYQEGERVLDIDTQYISIGAEIEHNATSHEITNQIIDWNKEHRPGKKAPTCPALLGEISFTKADKDRFYTTSHTGKRYLDTDKVLAVCKQAVGMTMSDDRPMFLSLHGDTECLHVHFAAAMVDSQGKIWDGSTMTNDQGEKVKVRDYRQWELTNEKLEIEHGLDRVQHRKAMQHEGEHRQSQVKRPSNAEVHLLKDKGVLSDNMDLAGRLEKAYNESDKQFDKFLELAEASGIRIKPNMSTTKVNGLSFAIDGMDGFIKASDLGNKYKWSKLEKELNYEHSRDFQKLAECKDRASNKRTAIETSIDEVERLNRNTEEFAEVVRLEQSANVTDTRINPSVGYEERVQYERTSGLHEKATGHRAFEDTTTTTDKGANSAIEHTGLGQDISGGSPGPEYRNDRHDASHELQIEQSGTTASIVNTVNGNSETENGNITASRGSEEEDKVKRRERSIKTLMLRGGYTREQAEAFYSNEQKIAEKKAEEPVWTPDKPVAKEPVKSETTRQLEAMLAFQKQSNRQQQSHTYGRSDDGLSM